jgi:hypothetical protein
MTEHHDRSAESEADIIARLEKWVGVTRNPTLIRDAISEIKNLRAPAQPAALPISIYLVEEDEQFVHLSVGGLHMARVPASSRKGIALLKLNSDLAAQPPAAPVETNAIAKDCREAASIWRTKIRRDASAENVAQIYERIADSLEVSQVQRSSADSAGLADLVAILRCPDDISIQERLDAADAIERIYSGSPQEVPDYETAARALGFQKMPSGRWWAPNPHWHVTYMCNWDTAEQIFETWGGADISPLSRPQSESGK